MSSLKELFIKQGFIVDSSFAKTDDVERLRLDSLRLLSTYEENTLRPSLFLTSQKISEVFFSQQFYSVINSISSEYRYFIPNFTVRNNLYIDWHFDDEFLGEDDGLLPQALQCNVYLQNNTLNHGGGIDICSGTQNLSHEEKKNWIKENQTSGQTICTQRGDLLIFDYRVIHRSTQPVEEPIVSDRLAIQMTVCKSIEAAQKVMAYFLRRRQESLHLSDFSRKRALSYFEDIPNINFPQSFLDETAETIKNLGIYIPTYQNLSKKVA